MSTIPLVTVTRYVTPLREGGSLPAIVEADNLGTYVMKFRGAGQGPLALVAEIIAGELARRLGLRVPELVLADLDPRIPGSEPDPEIQDLLRASEGLNLGVDFLPSSFGFDPLGWTADRDFASQVLWFDALVHNVDRTWRNPNLLVWHRDIWLIDHGAALYFHHNWPTADPKRPFDASEHVLRDRATALADAHAFRYLCARIELDESRLLALDPAADLDAVRAGLSAFEKACTEGPLAGRPLGERFRWLTAPRSTIVQPGPVHSGLTADPAAELTHLFDTLVSIDDREL